MSQNIMISPEPISPHFNGSSNQQQDAIPPQEHLLNQSFEVYLHQDFSNLISY